MLANIAVCLTTDPPLAGCAVTANLAKGRFLPRIQCLLMESVASRCILMDSQDSFFSCYPFHLDMAFKVTAFPQWLRFM